MAGYLDVPGIEAALVDLAARYPSLCTRLELEEKTYEGRTCSALKLGRSAGALNAVLLLGGVHAREIVNPEALVRLAYQLCQAYSAGAGLSFGSKSFAAADVKLLVENLDLYFFPQVNPDGRAYAMSTDPWWRKNRRPDAGSRCVGVDVNRNFDFLWSSGIGTSANPCSEVYRGAAAFSEVETRNVKSLLAAYPITVLVDVHSYSELILYPWGDDDNQVSTPTMSFSNPSYDGVRGATGDGTYREYIPEADLQWYAATADKVKAAIAAVRGRSYKPEPSAGLYTTSATSTDYGYSRHFTDGAQRKVRTFSIETGREFQPPYAEGLQVMAEASAGIVELCLSSVCIVESLSAGLSLATRMGDLRRLREDVLMTSPVGREYAALLEQHNRELLTMASRSREVREQGLAALLEVAEVALTAHEPKPRVFDAATIARARKVVALLAKRARPELAAALQRIDRDLPRFQGKSVAGGLRAIGRKTPARLARARPQRRTPRASARRAEPQA